MRWPLIEGFAFADDDESEMGEGRKIAAGAHGAFLRNDGMDAGVEQSRREAAASSTRHAAEALGEHVGAQQKHGARFGFAERLGPRRRHGCAPG